MLTITLEEAVKLITNVPKNKFMLMGEPGIGKSSLIEQIKEKMQHMTGLSYETAYIDVPNLDLGDIAMPVVEHDSKTTKYYPNSRFNITKPCIIMLDEFSKGCEAVKNMLHPLLEVNNPRLGDVPLHKDSIIFLTGNMTTDNVGDSLKAHSLNRITSVVVRKPSAKEWVSWAINSNRVAAEIIAWVDNTPHALASYLDNPKDTNQYIFNPKQVKGACVTPRSLERASAIITSRKEVGSNAMLAALSGTIGTAAALDMQAYIELADELTPLAELIENPLTAKIPDNSGACSVAVYGAVVAATEENFANIFKYIQRLSLEWQAVFCLSMYKSLSKQPIIFNSKEFTEWADKNSELLY